VNSRARFACLAAVAALAIAQLGGCADTPSTFYSVILSPKGPLFVAQGSSGTVITASVLNDTANGGVTYSLSPAGVGTLTQTSSSSATYTAPSSVSTPTTVVVTATAVDYAKSSANLTINVEPPPVITTTSLTSGSVGASYSQPINSTGGVPPFKWTIASGSLPAGLALDGSTTNTVNVVGKPTTEGPSTFTVTLTDAAGETVTSQPLTIVISSLAITTASPLPPATFTTPPTNYSEQFAATGGTPPYTWTLASGSTLPAGLTLSSSGLLSGAPTAQGTFTFGVTATDSEATPAAVTQQFTLVISGPQNLAGLTGNYAFTFTGNNSTGFLVTTAGAFVADGNGNITGGEQDTNTITAASEINTPNLTGTYTLGSDGRGTITFANAPNSPTYAFSIDATGTHGRVIEFDSTGSRGSGRLEKQTLTTCAVASGSTNSYGGTFVFAGSGYAGPQSAQGIGPLVFAGTFSGTPPAVGTTQGSLDNGEYDTNIGGTINGQVGPIGMGFYNSGNDTTHCSFQITPQWGVLNYNAYPVSATEAFLVEVDAYSAEPYVSALDMKQQTGYPFLTQGVLSSSLAGGLSGQFANDSGTFSPEAEIMQISPQSNGSFALLLTDNVAGSVLTNMQTSTTAPAPLTVSYSSDQLGRITTNLASPYQPVLYLVSSSEAFVLSNTAAPGFPIIVGHLDPQSVPAAPGFSTAYLTGNFVIGTATPPPSTAAGNVSGFFTLDGVGNIGGTQDVSTSSGNTASEAVAGTYNVLDIADGTGIVSLTSPASFGGVYVIVSPTKFVVLTITSGDTNPVVTIVGH
jgi:large repetitive protein